MWRGDHPHDDPKFFYDVAWWLAFGYRVAFDSAVDFSSGAGAGGYAYAKVGTY